MQMSSEPSVDDSLKNLGLILMNNNRTNIQEYVDLV